MEKFLLASAVLEIAISIPLFVAPDTLAVLLFGNVIGSAVGSAVARITGAALLSLGTACWFGRRDAQSAAVGGIAKGMLVYDVAVVVIFLMLRFTGMSGIGLLPAAAVHAAMAAWCIYCLG